MQKKRAVFLAASAAWILSLAGIVWAACGPVQVYNGPGDVIRGTYTYRGGGGTQQLRSDGGQPEWDGATGSCGTCNWIFESSIANAQVWVDGPGRCSLSISSVTGSSIIKQEKKDSAARTRDAIDTDWTGLGIALAMVSNLGPTAKGAIALGGASVLALKKHYEHIANDPPTQCDSTYWPDGDYYANPTNEGLYCSDATLDGDPQGVDWICQGMKGSAMSVAYYLDMAGGNADCGRRDDAEWALHQAGVLLPDLAWYYGTLRDTMMYAGFNPWTPENPDLMTPLNSIAQTLWQSGQELGQ